MCIRLLLPLRIANKAYLTIYIHPVACFSAYGVSFLFLPFSVAAKRIWPVCHQVIFTMIPTVNHNIFRCHSAVFTTDNFLHVAHCSGVRYTIINFQYSFYIQCVLPGIEIDCYFFALSCHYIERIVSADIAYFTFHFASPPKFL